MLGAVAAARLRGGGESGGAAAVRGRRPVGTVADAGLQQRR